MVIANEQTRTANSAWMYTLQDIFTAGLPVAPRGQETLEMLQHTMRVDMRFPVVTAPARKLSEKFLGAEAYWILTGDDTVAGISPFNKNISQFSDNGETFFGAYGPKIKEQLDYVVSKLKEDPDTRQAGLNIWRENPPPTKDVPCTVSMFFNIRGGRLNAHVFMRSSDIWLGVPYDVFNFSMVAHLICCRLNANAERRMIITPGILHLTAASRHLYLRNKPEAAAVFVDPESWAQSGATPFVTFTDEEKLMRTLDAIRHEDTGAMWWRHVDADFDS